ncbi:MAG: TetR/AcrR family transcriptional regulator [Solirubrobacterales bacterium]
MTASTEKQLRADARRNREAVVASARILFARDGRDAQMDEIAAHAGVGVGTVYRQFPAKQALLTEMVRSRFACFAEIAHEVEEIEDPLGAVEELFRRSAEAVEGDAGFQLAMMGSEELEWEGIEEEKKAFAVPAIRILKRAVDAGVVRKDLTFDDYPMLMCGITSIMYFDPPGAGWSRHVDLILAGLRSDA